VTGLPIPAADRLTRRQHQGWDCVWCGTSLWTGAILAGRAEGSVGAVDLSIDVYACPRCARLHVPQHATQGETP